MLSDHWKIAKCDLKNIKWNCFVFEIWSNNNILSEYEFDENYLSFFCNHIIEWIISRNKLKYNSTNFSDSHNFIYLIKMKRFNKLTF